MLRIDILGKNAVLEDVINTSLKRNFSEDLLKKFNKFYSSIFPMDMSQEAFLKYLKNVFPYSKAFDTAKFLENNFEEDGKSFVLNRFENFANTPTNEQYEMIMLSVAEISYEYFVSTKVAELSKQRVTIMLLELVEKIIADKANSVKEKMKKLCGHQ